MSVSSRLPVHVLVRRSTQVVTESTTVLFDTEMLLVSPHPSEARPLGSPAKGIPHGGWLGGCLDPQPLSRPSRARLRPAYNHTAWNKKKKKVRLRSWRKWAAGLIDQAAEAAKNQDYSREAQIYRALGRKSRTQHTAAPHRAARRGRRGTRGVRRPACATLVCSTRIRVTFVY